MLWVGRENVWSSLRKKTSNRVSVLLTLLQWHLKSYKNGNICEGCTWMDVMDMLMCTRIPCHLWYDVATTLLVKKKVMGTSIPHIFGENYSTTIHSHSRKAKGCWWLGDWYCLEYTAPSCRNISSAVQLQIFHEYLENSHYITLKQNQILFLQHSSPSVNL